MQFLTACPLCQDTNLLPYLVCKDHTVSHETFQLQQCARCSFVMTNPRPEDKALPAYYQSAAYISHTNKSRGVIDHLYKATRIFTCRWKYKLIHRFSAGKPTSVLDFGCGTGVFLMECMKKKLNVAGVEPSTVARAQAITNTKGPIASRLDHLTGSFDVITLWHVLEHVPELNETLARLASMLSHAGTMFIAVPNLKSADARKYSAQWAAYDVPRHLWHFSRESMQVLLKNHNMKLINVAPMHLDAYYVSLLSEQYQNPEQSVLNMARALVQGWKSNRKAEATQEYSSLIYIVRNEAK